VVDITEGDAKPWPVLDSVAYLGLPGDVVRAIEPHTEADPVAILVQYLAAAGNAIGRGPYYSVEGDRHCTNVFVTLVGETAKGRKGTSWSRVRQIIEIADPQWTTERVHGGLSSGEGVIWAVRDPIMGWDREGRVASARRVEVQIDSGIVDKRLFILEQEFAGALTVMRRQGNILSRIIRDAWDRGNLATLTKDSPTRATGAHISIVGHITANELRSSLDRISMSNGYANRFLWLMVRRGRVLPFGGMLDGQVICELGLRTRAAITAARQVGCVMWTAAAREAWARVYASLSAGQPGLLGAILARAEAQTIRLAVLYTLLDERREIGIEHLQAALAVWEYAEASAFFIWGDSLGDPVTDEILRALRKAGETGMTRTEIRDLFGRNATATRIRLAQRSLRSPRPAK
jgi:hypothetical protein